jgi:hypothetical protein
MEEHNKLIELIEKKKKHYSDLKRIVLSVRANHFKLPDVVMEFGLELIKKFKRRLGDECMYCFLQY